jgi:hypothetical protein
MLAWCAEAVTTTPSSLCVTTTTPSSLCPCHGSTTCVHHKINDLKSARETFLTVVIYACIYKHTTQGDGQHMHVDRRKHVGSEYICIISEIYLCKYIETQKIILCAHKRSTSPCIENPQKVKAKRMTILAPHRSIEELLHREKI